jgi:hypothetical protein
MSKSIPSTQAVSGPSISTMVLWSQTFTAFNKPLELTLSATPMDIVPPIFLLTVEYDGNIKRYQLQEGRDFNAQYEITGPLGTGTGVLVALTKWSHAQKGTTAHLNLTAYSALALIKIADESIVLA